MQQSLRLARTTWHAIRDDRGATAVEYALICALVFVAIVAAVGFLGTEVASFYDDIGTHLEDAQS